MKASMTDALSSVHRFMVEAIIPHKGLERRRRRSRSGLGRKKIRGEVARNGGDKRREFGVHLIWVWDLFGVNLGEF